MHGSVTALNCNGLTAGENATLSTTDTLYGTVVSATCNPGYFYNEAGSPSEKQVQCLVNVGNDDISWQGLDGYDHAGSTFASCSRKFQGHSYDDHVLKCIVHNDVIATAVTCDAPPEITDGTRTPAVTRSQYIYGEEVNYECDETFKFIDGTTSRTMRCLVALDDDGNEINGVGAWNNGDRQGTTDDDVTCRGLISLKSIVTGCKFNG